MVVAFRQAAPELAERIGGDAVLGPLLAEAAARGAAAWPQLAIDPAQLAAALARAVQGEADPRAALAELAVDDLHLAQACAAGVPGAVAAFDARCGGTMRAGLRQMQLSDALIDDVLQEVRTKLFAGGSDGPPKIATYSGRASLPGWARTVATRTAVSALRRRADLPTDDAVLQAVPASDDSPELRAFRDRYQAEFKAAFEAALATLEVRERNLLRHHYVDRLAIDDIGTLYGVHKTTAFRWLEAARDKLGKRTRREFQERALIPPAEMQSVMRLLYSNVELSLSRVMHEPAA